MANPTGVTATTNKAVSSLDSSLVSGCCYTYGCLPSIQPSFRLTLLHCCINALHSLYAVCTNAALQFNLENSLVCGCCYTYGCFAICLEPRF